MPPAESPTLVVSGRERMPSLDGLRGIAMLIVVGCHLIWPSATFHFDWIDRVLINGWIGVDLFFVLSGFLITGILLDARDGPRYFRNFYARRALRIFPIYYLFLVALFIWLPFGSWITLRTLPWQYTHMASHSAWYWTHTVNILHARTEVTEWFHTGHLWSLSVEEQFYLVWPALVFIIPRRRLPLACLLVCAIALLARVWWVATHDRLIGAYILTPLRMDSLAFGALVAALARSADGSTFLRRWYRPIGLSALAVALPVQVILGADLQNRWVIIVGYAANAIVFAAIIVWLLVDARPRKRLEWAPLRSVGRVSYGGYLYHLPLIGLCTPLRSRLIAAAGDNVVSITAAHVAWIGGMIALTIVVASISYRWIETPFLELKERFASTTPMPTNEAERRSGVQNAEALQRSSA
jgi:peptidoglycan/LPS O-acetylase OafA/YrhL